MAEWEATQREREEARKSVMAQPEPDADDEPVFVSYVPLPEQKEIELRVMKRKKQELMVCSTPSLRRHCNGRYEPTVSVPVLATGHLTPRMLGVGKPRRSKP